MSTVENFDGLCGIIARFASSDLQLRCHYELGHVPPCSFEKYRSQFHIESSCRPQTEMERLMEKDPDGIQRGFIESVLNGEKNDTNQS